MGSISKHSKHLGDFSDDEGYSSVSTAPGVTKRRGQRDKTDDSITPQAPATISFPDPHVESIQKHIESLPHTEQLISFFGQYSGADER